jgi:hypothetical protein
MFCASLGRQCQPGKPLPWPSQPQGLRRHAKIREGAGLRPPGPQVALRFHRPTPMMRKWLSLVAFLTAVSVSGCSKTYIPNTDVQDTGENRGIITFCEKYRHAIEDRDAGALLKMMSPAYFEDAGNVKGSDDADFEKIREFLMGDFLKTKGVRYEIRYRRITHTETNHIWVDYTYAGAWKIPGLKDEEWHHQVADNRLDLVRDGDSYKIVTGM